MMIQASIDEIFASMQGEGPRVGERHIFVRFQGCDIRCRYCDTVAALKPVGGTCRAQKRSGSFDHEQVQNPLTADRLTALCTRLKVRGPSKPVLSLTGGEPLLQQEFLSAWLPLVRPGFRVYLETNGILFSALQDLAGLIDVVSMDIKLPSATGLRPYWEEHRKFLAAALGTECFAKTVVTNDTVQEDILTAAAVLAEVDCSIPLIIQPASGAHAPLPSMLLDFQDAVLCILADVRIIPQAHKILQVP